MKRTQLNILEGAARALSLWRTAPPHCMTVPGATERAAIDGITVHTALERGFRELQLGRALIVTLTIAGYGLGLWFLNDDQAWISIALMAAPNLIYIVVVLLYQRIAKNVA